MRARPLRGVLALAGLLLAAAAVAYVPVWRNGFVNLDDGVYVTQNPRVLGGLTRAGAAWAFSATAPWNWHPLTWLSHQADVSLFGLDPRGHHATSLLLHGANVVLLFLLLRAMTGWLARSALAAALLALHPLHVETVAWVSDRKGVLAAFFFLLTLAAYLRYARRPGPLRYAPVLAAFLAGLMAKQVVVALPAVLLLLDFWPLGRLAASRRAVLLEKVPLALLALAGVALAWVLESRGGAALPLAAFPLGQRLGNAAVSCAAYLGAAVWPARLSCFYPHPGAALALWKPAAAVAAGAGATFLAAAARRRRPWLLAGWLWYLAMLAPALGIVQIGWHARADRHAYLPLIGIYLILAAAAGELATGGRRRRAAVAGVALLVLAALGAVTWRQVGFWRDDVTLFTHALDVTERNWFAHSNLAEAYARLGRLDLASEHFREALRINRAFAITGGGR